VKNDLKAVQLPEKGSVMYAAIISLVAAVGGFLFGYDMNIIAGAAPFLREEFALEGSSLGFAVASESIGCIIGALCACWLADIIGRRRSLMIAAILLGISAIGTAFPGTITEFNIYRIVGGLGVGLAAAVSPMYIAELAPAKIRGFLVTLNQLAIVIGCLIANVVSYILVRNLPEETCWRWMFGSECVPVLLLIAGLFFIPRSPRWLMEKGHHEEALLVLSKVDGEENARREIKEIQEVVSQETGSFSELFGPSIRKVFFISTVIFLFTQWGGITPLVFYAPIIFQKGGFVNADAAIMQTAIMNSFNLVCTITALLLVDRLGRRKLCLFSTLGMAFSLIIMGAVFHTGLTGIYVLLAFFLCIGTYVVGLAPLSWLLGAELFPTRIRAKGISLASLIGVWAGGFTVTWAFAPMAEFSEKHFGSISGMLWFFAFMCFIAFVFSLKFVPETKKKTLEEIALFWMKKKKNM